MRTRPTPFVVAALVVAASASVAVVAVGNGDSSPQTIDQCTTIDSSGEYVLGRNITANASSADPCIAIAASDVVLDGQGHTVAARDLESDGTSGIQAAIATDPHGTRNVTVRNVRVTGWNWPLGGGPKAAIAYRNVTGGAVRNVTASENHRSVGVWNSSGVAVTDNTLNGGTLGSTADTVAGVGLYGTVDSLVANNTARSHDIDVAVAGGPAGLARNVTVRDNALRHSFGNIEVRNAAGVTVAANAMNDSGYDVPNVGVSFRGTVGNATVRGNTVTGTDRAYVFGQRNETGRLLVANNTATDSYRGLVVRLSSNDATVTVVGNRFVRENLGVRASGVFIQSTGGARVRVAHNTIANDSNGVRVLGQRTCGPPMLANLTVRGNDFANDSRYAVRNEHDGVLNATHNYWGASNGPSSPGNETLHDPVTGAAADGDGGAVSGANGTANVHFDPWSNTTVAGDSSANNATAA